MLHGSTTAGYKNRYRNQSNGRKSNYGEFSEVGLKHSDLVVPIWHLKPENSHLEVTF